MFFKKYWAVILVAVVAAAVVYYYHKKQKSEASAKGISLGICEILPGASAVPQTGGFAGGLDVETSDI